MRCAVDGWSSAFPEASLRLTASGDSASTSSRRIIRSMTWMEFLDSLSFISICHDTREAPPLVLPEARSPSDSLGLSQPAKFYPTIRDRGADGLSYARLASRRFHQRRARRPLRHLSRRSHAPEHRLRGDQAARSGRVRGPRAAGADLLRTAGVQLGRPRIGPR